MAGLASVVKHSSSTTLHGAAQPPLRLFLPEL